MYLSVLLLFVAGLSMACFLLADSRIHIINAAVSLTGNHEYIFCNIMVHTHLVMCRA